MKVAVGSMVSGDVSAMGKNADEFLADRNTGIDT
jgi:hypothetical protein